MILRPSFYCIIREIKSFWGERNRIEYALKYFLIHSFDLRGCLMKTDSVVIKRFEELEERATKIIENKVYAFTSNKGERYFKVDEPVYKGWALNVLNLLGRVFGEDNIHYKVFLNKFDNIREYESDILEALELFKAAKDDFVGGYLFSTRALIQAEVFSDTLEQASELLRSGYKDPACVVAGVALETTLKELCSRNGISITKLDKMNADLCKSGVYNMGVQKQITAWAEHRNKAAHGEWSEYKDADVEDMINGVNRLIAEYL
jgi:HEPN domain-containing protein